MFHSKSVVGALALSLVASASHATAVKIDESDFLPAAGIITFDEFAVLTENPTYAPGDYGGGVGAPTVTFDGWFEGQSLSLSPGTDCPGAAATACVIGSPTGPLALDASSPNTLIVTDDASPTSPVLSGTPEFNGAIAILFSTDQFAVGFDGGFFNSVGSTGITAFDRDGNLIGTVVNEAGGIEFLGLASDTNEIAGVFLDLVGAEEAGFGIDNLRFGTQDQIVDPEVIPLPASHLALIAGLFGLYSLRRRKSA